ncbi:MAG: gliding motility-associated C-terminal domain-containing protein [Crocinitomicaceae bacterium]
MKNFILLISVLTSTLVAQSQMGSSCADAITLYPNTDCNNSCGAQYCGTYASLWADQGSINSAGYGNVEGIDGSCAGDDLTQDVLWAKVCATTTSFTLNNTAATGPAPPSRDYAVFTGSCGSLTEFGCYTVVGNGSTTVTGLTAGECYYIMISAAGTGTSTYQRLCVTSTVPYTPPNDDCANSSTLSTDITLTATNANTTATGVICSGSVENSAWYQWCAPASWPAGQQAYINLNNQVCNSTQGLQLSVWGTGSTCPTISTDSSIVCENPGNQTDYYYQWTAVANSCYYITIDGYAGTACTYDLTVGSIPVADCEPNGGSIGSNQSICSGDDPATLTDVTSPFNGNGTWTYGWQMDVDCDGSWTTISGATGLTYDPPVLTQTTCYRRVATNSCDGVPVYSNAVTITVNPLPTPNAGPDVSVCQGSSVTIGADPIYNVDGSDYAWDNGAGSGTLDLVGGTDNGQVSVSPASNTTYTVTLTDPNGCIGTDATNVTVVTPPNAGTNGTVDICTNEPSVDLFTLLGGTPDGGGTWSGPSVLTNGDQGTFDPATMSGGTYTYTVTGTAPCPDATADVIVNLTTGPNAGTNGSVSFCPTDAAADLFNELGGTPDNGGVWSGPSTLDNGDQGTFDPATDNSGTYTYTVSVAGCPDATADVAVNITTGADATIDPAGPFCLEDNSVNLTAVDGGGDWSGPGITDAVAGTFDPSAAGVGTHTVTYTISGGCGDSDTEDIIVNAMDDPAFTYPQNNYCLSEPNPTPTVTGLAGGTFTVNNSGVIDASTGEFDIASSGTGTYQIVYTTTGTCPDTAIFTMNIDPNFDATITPAGPYCEGDAVDTLTAVDPGGTWSGPGITDATIGEFNPATAGPGTHDIIYAITGTCGDDDTIQVTVNPTDDASFSYDQGAYCLASSNPVPVITGDAGGTFSASGGAIIEPVSGELDIASSGVGTYTITYTTAGPCTNSSAVTVNIVTDIDATIDGVGAYCVSDNNDTLTAATTGGTWTGSGIIDNSLGVFDPSVAVIGSQDIIYNIGSGECTAADTISIIVNALPIVTVSEDQSVSAGGTVTLTATGGGTYSWSPDGSLSCSDCESPTASPSETTDYCVTVTSDEGCVDSACTRVTTVNAECEVFVPEAFSPNGDNNNDLQCVYGPCIASVDFQIFDRWGEKVFITTNPGDCWDGTFKGKPMSSGVYAYTLTYTLTSGEEFTAKGNISLIR